MTMKTEDGIEYPAAAFAYTPDAEKPSTWKLRLWETPEKKMTARQVGMAVAALGPGGFRGNRVQIPSEDLAAVKRKVLAAWRKVNPDAKSEDVPAVLKGGNMTPEDLEKKLGELEANVDKLETDLKKERDRADRFEAMSKLNDAEKEFLGKLGAEEQTAFIAATPEVRKSRMEAVAKKADEVSEPVRKRLEALEADIEKRKEENTRLAGELAKVDDARRQLEFTKRAEEEYPNLPGKPEDKGRVLKVLDGKLAEADRKVLDEMLKAGDNACASAAHAVGTSRTGTGTAEGELEKLAKKIAAEEKVTVEKGWVLAMERNPELYERYKQEHAGRTQ